MSLYYIQKYICIRSEKRERTEHDGVSCFLGAHVVEGWVGPLFLYLCSFSGVEKLKKDMSDYVPIANHFGLLGTDRWLEGGEIE